MVFDGLLADREGVGDLLVLDGLERLGRVDLREATGRQQTTGDQQRDVLVFALGGDLG